MRLPRPLRPSWVAGAVIAGGLLVVGAVGVVLHRRSWRGIHEQLDEILGVGAPTERVR